MKWWIAFWNILVKDMRAYYLMNHYTFAGLPKCDENAEL